MTAFLVVLAVAAVVTAVVTPAVIRMARRIGAVDPPADPRKVHTEPVPTLGGIAMIAGFLAAVLVAWQLSEFDPLFTRTSEPLGVLAGLGLIGALGILDDLLGLPPTVKLAGQIVAAAAPVLFGIQIVYAWIPGLGVLSLGPDIGFVLTVAALVAMINAVNLIDGLDGLAAGVVAIGAVAFFVFTALTGTSGLTEAVPNAGPLVAAVLVGVCAGFLVHNFHPASIFMGDTGSMTLGLMLAISGVSYVGRSTAPISADFFGAIPLLIPVLVLAVPFVDTAFAVARRAYRGRPLTVGDKGHLHHLLIAFGHSHRRAVLTLYYWSALVASAAVALSLAFFRELVPWLIGAVLLGMAITALGVRRRPDVDTGDERPVADHPRSTLREIS